MSEPHALLFASNGTVQLLDREKKVLWSSEDDEEFRDEFEDEFLNYDDCEDILEYLEDNGHVQDASDLEIFEDSLESNNVIDPDSVEFGDAELDEDFDNQED